MTPDLPYVTGTLTGADRQRPLDELDYLTTEDAAAYCRVSLSQFKKHAPALCIRPFTFMGKKVYRKADLKSVMERAWQQSTSGASPGISAGSDQTVIDLAKVLAPSRPLKPVQPLGTCVFV